jgi:hypothetical protein
MCGSEGVRCGASGAIGPALVPKLVGETRAEAAVHQLTALPEPPAETFRDWWRRERGEGGAQEPARPRYLDSGPRWRPIQIASKNGAERTGGNARHTILSAIRSALADRPAPADVPRDYRRRSERSRAESVARFADRVGEYRATVRRAAAGELGEAPAVLCREAGARTLAVPRDPRTRGVHRASSSCPTAASLRTSSTSSTAPSPAEPSGSPRRAPSCSTAAPERLDFRDRELGEERPRELRRPFVCAGRSEAG